MSYYCKICFKQLSGDDIIPFFQAFKREAIQRIPEIAKENAFASPIMRKHPELFERFEVTPELRRETKDWGSLNVFRYKYFFNKELGLLGMYNVHNHLDGLFDCVAHFQNSCDRDYKFDYWKGVSCFESIAEKWQNAALEDVTAHFEKVWGGIDGSSGLDYYRRTAAYDEIWANFESTLEDRDSSLYLALFGAYDLEPLSRFCVCIEKAVADTIAEWEAEIGSKRREAKHEG